MNASFFLAFVFLGPALFVLVAGACNSAARNRAKRAHAFADKPRRAQGRPHKKPPNEAPARVTPPSEAPRQPEPKPEAERTETVSAAVRPFAGEIVAFTGTCPKLDRRAMIAHTARLGGKAYETINTRCTLLVVGEKPGKNQLDRAAKWHTKTIPWQEWYTRAFGKNALPAPQNVQGITLDEFAAMLDAA